MKRLKMRRVSQNTIGGNKLNAVLDAVTKSKTAYVTAKTTLEAKLREQLRSELSNLQTQIDIAVRLAFNEGQSKADIMRALGTKDYHTVNACLARTEGVEEVHGVDPLDATYRLEDDVLHVTYVKHGPQQYTGVASFDVKRMVGGDVMFLSRDKLWNEDYSVRNDVVAVLDQAKDGFYFEEAKDWFNGQL